MNLLEPGDEVVVGVNGVFGTRMVEVSERAGAVAVRVEAPWGRVVLTEGRVFVARTPEEIRRAFTDHELIASLGIGSIMNVPIGFAGRRLGTMNVSHQADWFTPEDADTGRVIAAVLAPALFAGSVP